MIFVTVGTQRFPFNRLLREIDNLIERNIITEPVTAQTGYSTYHPKNYTAIDFMDKEAFDQSIHDCGLLITHGGVGTITKGLEFRKKIIVVPRKKAFGEHVDDHQEEIAGRFEEMGYISVCREVEELERCYYGMEDFSSKELKLYFSNTVDFINDYLSKIAQDLK